MKTKARETILRITIKKEAEERARGFFKIHVCHPDLHHTLSVASRRCFTIALFYKHIPTVPTLSLLLTVSPAMSHVKNWAAVAPARQLSPSPATPK